jgi:hypothetical protein
MHVWQVEIKMKAGLLVEISVSKPALFIPGHERGD